MPVAHHKDRSLYIRNMWVMTCEDTEGSVWEIHITLSSESLYNFISEKYIFYKYISSIAVYTPKML